MTTKFPFENHSNCRSILFENDTTVIVLRFVVRFHRQNGVDVFDWSFTSEFLCFVTSLLTVVFELLSCHHQSNKMGAARFSDGDDRRGADDGRDDLASCLCT